MEELHKWNWEASPIEPGALDCFLDAFLDKTIPPPPEMSTTEFFSAHFNHMGVKGDANCFGYAPFGSLGLLEHTTDDDAVNSMPTTQDLRFMQLLRHRQADFLLSGDECAVLMRNYYDLNNADGSPKREKIDAMRCGPVYDESVSFELGDWNRQYYMPSLACVLGMDVVSYVPSQNQSVTTYFADVRQLSGRGRMSLSDIDARLKSPTETPMVEVEWNGSNRYTALVPKSGHTLIDGNRPSIAWLEERLIETCPICCETVAPEAKVTFACHSTHWGCETCVGAHVKSSSHCFLCNVQIVRWQKGAGTPFVESILEDYQNYPSGNPEMGFGSGEEDGNTSDAPDVVVAQLRHSRRTQRTARLRQSDIDAQERERLQAAERRLSQQLSERNARVTARGARSAPTALPAAPAVDRAQHAINGTAAMETDGECLACFLQPHWAPHTLLLLTLAAIDSRFFSDPHAAVSSSASAASSSANTNIAATADALDEDEAGVATTATTATTALVPNPSSDPFGPGTSRYYSRLLTTQYETALLAYCRDKVRFQIYQCTSQRRIKGGEPRLKAPKAEFYLLDSEGRRPHYKWTQLNDFDHAGQPMPPILANLCEALNDHFKLTGDDRFIHCLIICNEQSGEGADAHCAPPHADKIQRGFFADLSLGYARQFDLIDASDGKTVVASQRLASASGAFITADDNGRLVQGNQRAAGEPKVVGTRVLHAVPIDAQQPRDQPRFSLVFRPITDHPKGSKCGEHLARVDEAKAARVRPGGDLWREYVPLCRNGNGAQPASSSANTSNAANVSPNDLFSLILTENAETKYTMESVGTMATRGTSVAQLRAIESELSSRDLKVALHDLTQLLVGLGHTDVPAAGHLSIRGSGNVPAINKVLVDVDDAEAKILAEVRSMPFDTEALVTKGGSLGRMNTFHCIVVADFEREPDVPNGQCRVVDIKNYPVIAKFHSAGAKLLGVPGSVLKLAINHYYDAVKCGIGERACLCDRTCVTMLRSSACTNATFAHVHLECHR